MVSSVVRNWESEPEGSRPDLGVAVWTCAQSQSQTEGNRPDLGVAVWRCAQSQRVTRSRQNHTSVSGVVSSSAADNRSRWGRANRDALW
eukprot:365694-Chlamydomonas_euryale.AAC.16